MCEKKNEIHTIDEYIQQFPKETRVRLNALREAIHKAVPGAAEKISWGMATFTLNGNLVHFAAHKNHIGFYPGVSGVATFSAELEGYKTSKGAIQFPNEGPLPLALVHKIVTFRAAENLLPKGKSKKTK